MGSGEYGNNHIYLFFAQFSDEILQVILAIIQHVLNHFFAFRGQTHDFFAARGRVFGNGKNVERRIGQRAYGF